MSEAEKPSDRAGSSTHAIRAAARAGAAPAGSSPALLPGGDDDRHDALLPLPISPSAPRGAGRPLGAKNRRTDLVAQYLVDRFGDPLTASMATASMPLKDLVTELRKVASDCGLKLGASVMDIARFQRDCRNDALPFIHAKRAPETAKGEVAVPVIAVGRFEQTNNFAAGGAMSIEDALAARNMKTVENQTVTPSDAEVSHGEMSHDERSADE